jgi:hypothetical protein
MAHNPVGGDGLHEDLNKIVQANIRRILGDRTPEAYCNELGRQLYYVSGNKRGRKVAPRALRYAITEEQSPRLDLIAAVAAKERIAAHRLLIPIDRPPLARRWDDDRSSPLAS